MDKLLISPSPHIHSGDSIEKNMYGVLIALIPAFICSVVFFGMGAIIVTLTSVIACLFFEYVIQKFILKRQPTIWDGSALITGVLLAFNVPSNLPVWIIIIGALVAIGIGKMSFGGLGCNIFNPALVGRVFLLISFPVQMTTWPLAQGFNSSYVDAATGATPLSLLKEAVKSGQSVNSGRSSRIRPADRFRLHAGTENHHLAYSSNHLPDCIYIQWHSECLQPGTIRQPLVPSAIGRSDAGRHLHGNGLCHVPHEP